jgi:threonine/homoserine/homoserine lactone efflux protein
MLHTFLQGVLVGMTIAIMLGPAFFTLIQTSIHRGFKSGLFLSLGIFFSDLTLVVLCYLGISQFIYDPEHQLVLGIVGGVILIIFGIVTFNRKIRIQEDEDTIQVKGPGIFTFVAKGYFLNFSNPFLWIFWMGVMGVVSSNYGKDVEKVVSFFLGTLGTVLMTDLLKSFVANKIKQHLNSGVMHWINRIVGITLILFGLLLMLRVIFNR